MRSTGAGPRLIGSGSGVSDEEDVCHAQAIEQLADDLGISMEEAEELLEIMRDLVDTEEFDAFVEGLCDQ